MMLAEDVVQYGKDLCEITVRVGQQARPQPVGQRDRLLVLIGRNQDDAGVMKEIADGGQIEEVILVRSEQDGDGKIIMRLQEPVRKVVNGPTRLGPPPGDQFFDHSLQSLLCPPVHRRIKDHVHNPYLSHALEVK